MKDVSITIRGKDRPHLDAIQADWPVPQADIIGAALRLFRRLGSDVQASEIRDTVRSRRGKREPQPA